MLINWRLFTPKFETGKPLVLAYRAIGLDIIKVILQGVRLNEELIFKHTLNTKP